MTATPVIAPSSVRYVKLGEGGGWEKECIANSVLRFGFESGDPETIAQCEAGDWEALAKSWRAAGKSPSTATRFTNDAQVLGSRSGRSLDHLRRGAALLGLP